MLKYDTTMTHQSHELVNDITMRDEQAMKFEINKYN